MINARSVWLVLALGVIGAVPSKGFVEAAPAVVRIGLWTGATAVRITSASPFSVSGLPTLTGDQGVELLPHPADSSWLAVATTAAGPAAYTIERCTFEGSASFNVTRFDTGASTLYRGRLEVRTGSQGLTLIDQLPLDDYLKGVVPSEVPATFPGEALKAMAVVTRTFTLSHLGQHRSEGFDLCSGVHCQVYRGQTQESGSSSAAIEATRGQTLSFEGHPIEASFSACCGGHSVDMLTAWPSRPPKPCLVGDWDQPDGQPRPDLTKEQQLRSWIDGPPAGYCQAAKRSRWATTLSWVDLEVRLAQSLPVLLGADFHGFQAVSNVSVKRRDVSGRVAELEILTDRGPYVVREDATRWITSGGRPAAGALFSSLFWCEDSGDDKVAGLAAGAASVAGGGRTLTFHGAGWGHGVGLCQEGAAGRALAGQSYRDIMQHYYPGSLLVDAAGPLAPQASPISTPSLPTP